MYTANILDVTKERLQEDNSEFLAVRFEITDGKNTVVRNEGFPLDSKPEEIEEAVQAHLNLYKSEKERHEQNREAEAIQTEANKTISKLQGKTFKVK
jgi:hypothetical protein